jgi:NAD+ synthase (glutamine-hydrolysing)
MRVRIEQLNPVIGDLNGNRDLILSALEKAEKAGIDLLILPELVTTGYSPQDLLEAESFRGRCYEVNRECVEATGKTALLFGTITPNSAQYGRKMFNSALLARHGELLGTVHKSLLPTYDIFDELRYFEPNQRFECLMLDGVKLGVTICEDIWHNENDIQYHTYPINPALELKKAGADVIINISASPYTHTKHEGRLSLLQKHARECSLPIFYSNQAGANTDVISDGDSMAVTASGDAVARTEPFQSSFTDVEWAPENGTVEPLNDSQPIYPANRYERQFKAITCGIREYVEKTGITDKVVVGLSGGIDSALVCALAAEALGAGNVKAITMPAQYSSSGSVTDSEELAENLGIELFNIPIETLFDQYRSALGPVFGDLPFNVAEENLQSRIRGALLMAYANKFGCFLLATGNKSEYAVGYATLYGDMNGALAPIGDLYKSEVFELSKWLNTSYYKKEVIPESILTKAPSAELRPGQKDIDSLPEYDILDNILIQYLEQQKCKNELVDAGFDADTVQRVIQLVDNNEFKRFQSAPILKLTSKSFGMGRRRPIVQRWTAQNI